MAVYKATLYFSGQQTFEIEAQDDEAAEYKAIEVLQRACGGVPVEVNDAVVVKSDCQYTAQQELEDREGTDE